MLQQYVQKLIQFDKKTLHQLLFIFQYNILYVVIAFLLGSFANYIFPVYNEQKTNSQLIFEILFQIIVLSLFIFYSQKIINCVPYVGQSYMDEERILNFYQDNFFLPSFPIGIILFTMTLIATQSHLIDKLNLLNHRINHKYSHAHNTLQHVYANTFQNKSQEIPTTPPPQEIPAIPPPQEIPATPPPQEIPSSPPPQNEYQDRILPVLTRDVQEKNNMNIQHTDISQLQINGQETQYDYTNPLNHINHDHTTFQSLETNGNFSLLNEKPNQTINSSTLNYSEILQSM